MILDALCTAITALAVWIALAIFIIGYRAVCRRERGGK